MTNRIDRNVQLLAGGRLNPNVTVEVSQPRYTPRSGEDVVIVDTPAIMASSASLGSIASVAVGASAGSIAAVSSRASRATYASIASAGSITGAASSGSIPTIASASCIPSRALLASQGSAAGVSRSSVASFAGISSLAGPVFIDFPAIESAQPTRVVKRGASGVAVYRSVDSKTFNGATRRDISTEHQVDFVVPSSTNWSVQS